MNGNHNLTAVFAVASLFSDGFESGNFNAWSGTIRSTGETTTVVTSPRHDGANSGMFASNGGGGYEYSYAYWSAPSLSELYARGYFYVSQSGVQDSADRLYLISLRAGTNDVAFAGWGISGGVLKWVLMIRSGTTYAIIFSSSTPVTGNWYSVEMHWRLGSSNGLGELYIDGVLVCSLTNRNTSSYGSVTAVRFGIAQAYQCASTTVYADSCVVSNTYVGTGITSFQTQLNTETLIATDASTVQNSFPDKPSAD
jgi:hypothetical protein